MGAETARVGGLQLLAIVSRREAVDGVRAPPGPTVRPARGSSPREGGSRGASSPTRARGNLPHIYLARHPLEREQETALNLLVEEGQRLRLRVR